MGGIKGSNFKEGGQAGHSNAHLFKATFDVVFFNTNALSKTLVKHTRMHCKEA